MTTLKRVDSRINRVMPCGVPMETYTGTNPRRFVLQRLERKVN